MSTKIFIWSHNYFVICVIKYCIRFMLVSCHWLFNLFPPAFHSSSYHIYFTMSSLFRSVFTARFHFTFRKGRKKTKQARSGVAIWIILCEQSQISTSTLYLRRKGHIMGLFCIGLGTTDSQTWKQVCLNLWYNVVTFNIIAPHSLTEESINSTKSVVWCNCFSTRMAWLCFI